MKDIADKVIYSLTSALGVPFTLWLILCLCSSWELRSRLAGRLMTSSLLASLLDLGVLSIFHLMPSNFFDGVCIIDVYVHLYRIENFVFNWTQVLLLAVHVAQLTDFDPTRELIPRTRTIISCALVATPWLIGALMYPVVAKIHDHYLCTSSGWPSAPIEVLNAVFIVECLVPAVLVLLLAGVAVVLSRRQSVKRRVELRTRSVDPLLPYMLMAAIMSYEIPYSILSTSVVDTSSISHTLVENLFDAGEYIDVFRNFLLPAIFLLLPDVRENACDVTLRLWKRATGRCGGRESPGVDMQVIYSNKREPDPEDMGYF